MTAINRRLTASHSQSPDLVASPRGLGFLKAEGRSHVVLVIMMSSMPLRRETPLQLARISTSFMPPMSPTQIGESNSRRERN